MIVAEIKARHKQRLDVVKPIGALPQDTKSQVQFDICLDNHLLYFLTVALNPFIIKSISILLVAKSDVGQ